ncbi:SusC/RagA family TonB-linked outer membrane protein [Mariniflexile sp. HMF6888]|uniref:SusC/RagA family TonB-linked outer membrane protein n=1 Tax=Mariniflexile sp. HMF6888 TaxID=3373086 RepID=UPI0037B1AF0B
MKKITKLRVLCFLSLLFTTYIQAQDLTVSGTISDGNGIPLPGVAILLKNTTKGTITDFDGKFEIEAPSNGVLVVSYIGYTTIEAPINGKSSITITLIENVEALDEVVVVGYGTQKKSNLTGSVASIKTEEINKSTSTSIGQLLQGKATGLQALQNSAQPGGSVSLVIRGVTTQNASSNPLIVIDGFPTSGVSGESGAFYGSGSSDNALNSINPNDIESIEVLKDASSTAIYGARAANGVILITTKRGKEGKIKVNYEGSCSTQRYSEVWDMLGAKDYMLQANRILKERWRAQNDIYPYGTIAEADATVPFTPRYSDTDITEKSQNPTDWLGAILRTGFINQQNLSMSGGTSTFKYMSSINYYNQDGIIKNNDFQRVTGRVNLDQNIGEFFKVGISSMITNNTTNNVPLGGGNAGGIVQLAITANPIIPVRNPDGSYPQDPNNTFTPNPASLLEITDVTKFKRQLINSFIEFNPIKDLVFRLNLGYDGSHTERNQYVPKSTKEGFDKGGIASISNNRFDNTIIEGYGKYTKQISDHNLSLLAGYSYQKFQSSGSSISNTDFMFDSFKWYNIGSGQAEKPLISSYGGSYNLISYYSRLNYNFKEKYLLTANFRIDGSPKFAESKQWGYFPSLSAGWRVSEEQFFQSLKPVFSNLKFRIGYGVTGNDDVGNRTLDAYRVGQNFGFGNLETFGVYASQLGNKDLKWESTKDINLGFDFGFLNERINGSFEIYQKTTYDLLSSRILPNHNEITSIPDNIGAIRAKGFEFSINSHLLNSDKFKWNMGLNLSSTRVFWQERADNWKPEIYEGYHDPVRAIYSYESDGITELGETVAHMPGAIPGSIKFKDINGYERDANGDPITDANGHFVLSGQPDGVLDNADRKLMGSWDPKYNLGFSNTFKYKNFDLNIYMYAFLDYKKVNNTRNSFSLEAYRITEGWNLFNEVKNDSWSSDNPTGTRPNVLSGLYNSYGTGDYNIEKADFLRCKNITLGYTLPTINALGISKARVYASAENLFVLTSFSGTDPETDSFAGYPNQRSFTIGLNLVF